jgi:hypothetical protein
METEPLLRIRPTIPVVDTIWPSKTVSSGKEKFISATNSLAPITRELLTGHCAFE